MTARIEIVLPGLPRGKGRPRMTVRNGHARAYTDEKTLSFEGALRMAGREAMQGRPPLEGPLHINMVAVFPVPMSWSKTKRREALANQRRPMGKPDLDNVMKCADALNAVVWRDDSQIVSAHIIKEYGSEPELSILVVEVLP